MDQFGWRGVADNMHAGRCARAIAPMGHRKEMSMSEKRTVEKAQRAKRAGKAATTQAGEFVRDEVRKIRHGAHGARSPQQVIAIGLSEARRAGVALPPPKEGRAKEQTRRSAKYAYEAGQHKRKTRRRPRVSRAVSRVLRSEEHTSELQSRENLVCRLLLEKKKKNECLFYTVKKKKKTKK